MYFLRIEERNATNGHFHITKCLLTREHTGLGQARPAGYIWVWASQDEDWETKLWMKRTGSRRQNIKLRITSLITRLSTQEQWPSPALHHRAMRRALIMSIENSFHLDCSLNSLGRWKELSSTDSLHLVLFHSRLNTVLKANFQQEIGRWWALTHLSYFEKKQDIKQWKLSKVYIAKICN